MPLDIREGGRVDFVQVLPARTPQQLGQLMQALCRTYELPVYPNASALTLHGQADDHGTFTHYYSLTQLPSLCTPPR